ncbi:TonB-dependent receptor [uncultured Polaribacter sp.]|uniref:SusC/RagA family TonB-linked outer membrane protein n=1 Tax=uncultured Polaribacter sp. TaxID=174711 RepID=UPI002609EC93|nr:TonB-dependent receptor [uncultured Polaribacter sp.]
MRIKSAKLKKLLKCKVLFVCCLFISLISFSQTIIVTGVVSGSGDVLPGATIIVKGQKNGVVADFEGNYSINVKETDILIFSYLGYKDKQEIVASRTKIDVVLEEEARGLEEIVIVGYGTQKRKDISGAVSSIKNEEFDNVKANSFEGSLQSRAAGVQVVSSEGGPDSGFKVRIRGGNSITASSDPLYVVDGFPLPDTGLRSNGSTGLGNSRVSPLSTIDPSTIESIEVLKDASAAAIYGSRGSNGVVLITTKKGKKGKATFNFESFGVISMLSNRMDVLSAQEFVDWRLEFTPWDPNSQNPLVGAYRDEFGNAVSLNDPRIKLNDWQDRIFRTAYTKNYKLSMSGGAENNTYSGSFTYADQEGIIETSRIERYNLNLNFDQNVGERFKTGASINAGFIKKNGVVTAATEDANGRSGVVTNALSFSPAQGLVQFPDAEYDNEGNLLSFRNGDFANPNRILNDNINIGKTFQSFVNVYLEYKITDGLKFKSTVGGNIYYNQGEAYFSEKFGWSAQVGGAAFTGKGLGLGVRTEQSLNFRKNFNGKHTIDVISIYEEQQNSWETISNAAFGFEIPGVNLGNLESALQTNPTDSFKQKNQTRSFITRLQYDFSDRFVVNLAGRYDASSKFAEDNRWGFFPSAGFAWKISNENFFKNNKTINDAKLKMSFGQTGNAQITPYRSLAQVRLASYVYEGNQINTGVGITQLQNDQLTWEKTSEFNTGLTLGIFNNRLWIEADYYYKRTNDLLLEVPLPATSGYKTVLKNLGSLANTGFEFLVNTTNIQRKDFSWKSSFNITFNKNEVLDIGTADQIFIESIGSNQIGDDYIIKVGEPLGSVFGLETDGVYNYSDFVEFDGLTNTEAATKIRTDAAVQGVPYFDVFYTLKPGITKVNSANYRPGMAKFKDQNGDGVVNTEDRTIIGRTVPRHFGGFTNNLKYKNFDLSILMSWSYGNEIYNKTKRLLSDQGVPFPNRFGIIADRWTPENPDSDIPGVFGEEDAALKGNAYSSSIEDGSYLRMSNITFGYNLPKSLLNKVSLSSLRFYASADNVFIITDYTGFDPDVNVGGNQLTPGLDFDAYPRSRNFRMGLILGF